MEIDSKNVEVQPPLSEQTPTKDSATGEESSAVPSVHRFAPVEPQTPVSCVTRIRRVAFFGAVAFFVFSVLIALVIEWIQVERESARRMKCAAHLKQIAFALHHYHDMYGSFPPAYTVDSEGKPLHSWRTLLLPFLEQEALYEQIRLDEPWDSAWNRQFADENLPFYCPSGIRGDLPSGDCYYSVVVGEGTCFPGEKSVSFSDITDGTSNTVLIIERRTPINWMVPNAEITLDTALEGIDPANENRQIASAHPGGANVALVDGSIRFINYGIAWELWKSMLSISDRTADKKR